MAPPHKTAQLPLDFGKASDRHWNDADFLEKNKRFENADHLFGISAECALKEVLLAMGAPRTSSGELSKADQQEHINELWGQFHYFAESYQGAQYAALLGKKNPFADWRVKQRYCNDGYIKPERLREHRVGAFKARQVLQEARLNKGTPK